MDIKNDLEKGCEHVQSLKHLNMLSVKAALKTSKLGGILPAALLDFLILPEFDDIEEKYFPDNDRWRHL